MTNARYVGDPAPEISLKDAKGNTFNLSDFTGPDVKHPRVVVLSYWSRHCGPCQRELKVLSSMYREYGNKVLFRFINVDPKKSQSSALKWANSYTIGHLVLFDTDSKSAYDIGAFQLFEGGCNISIPDCYVIGRDGKIAFYTEGFEPDFSRILDKAIRQALQTDGSPLP